MTADLVEGLTANLISISQLCEQGLKIHFNNSECTILKDQEVVMKGKKGKDECYLWTPQNNSPKIVCLLVKEENAKISYMMSQHLYIASEAETITVGDVKVTLGSYTSKSM
jgi:hypothetical protein